jgi:hypothetical protein
MEQLSEYEEYTEMTTEEILDWCLSQPCELTEEEWLNMCIIWEGDYEYNH